MAACFEIKTSSICLFALFCGVFVPIFQCQAESELNAVGQETQNPPPSTTEVNGTTETAALDGADDQVCQNGSSTNFFDYVMEVERARGCRGVGTECRRRRGKDNCCKKPYYLQCRSQLCKIKECVCHKKCGGMGICADTTGNCDCNACVCKFQNAKASGVEINFYLTLAVSIMSMGSRIIL